MLSRLCFFCAGISQWSHNFRTSYLLLWDYLIAPLKPRCVLALTATASPDALQHVVEALSIKATVRASLLRPNLNLSVQQDVDRRAALIKLLSSPLMRSCWESGDGRAIVYVMTQRDVEQISALLSQRGIPAQPYHAGLERAERRRREEDFSAGRVRVMVCTVAFGMGIDVSNVRIIIHFNLPKAPENYVQEVGRAGRDGLPAHCVLLLCKEDLVRLRSLCFSEGIDARCIRDIIVDLVHRGNGSIVMADVVKRHDVRLEVVATLLAWLHIDGYVRVLPENYASFGVALFTSLDGVAKPNKKKSRALPEFGEDDEEASMLHFIAEHGKRPTAASEWTFINAAAAQAAMPRIKVHALLERMKQKGTLRYKADHKAFFFEVTDRMRELDGAALTKLVVDVNTRLQKVERCNVQKLHALYNAMYDAIQAPPEAMDAMLKEHLDHYFTVGSVSTAVDYAQGAIVDASKDSFLRGDITTLLNSARESLRTGRQVARVLHGLDSPEFPASAWCTNRFWGKAKHVDFASLMAFATEIILQNRY